MYLDRLLIPLQSAVYNTKDGDTGILVPYQPRKAAKQVQSSANKTFQLGSPKWESKMRVDRVQLSKTRL